MSKRAYICDHCHNIFAEDAIEAHETQCVYNPSNKTCYTCCHCEKHNGGPVLDAFWGYNPNREFLYCVKNPDKHRIDDPAGGCEDYEFGEPHYWLPI